MSVIGESDIVPSRQPCPHVRFDADGGTSYCSLNPVTTRIVDIVFDGPVMESMARVVASQNLLSAAENEGRALLVTKTRQAEAEGNAIRISAEADRVAQKLRGEGIALFREEAGRGMSVAVKEMEAAGMAPSLILFQMWTESLKHVAENGRGNVIFLDGSPQGMERTMQQMSALQLAASAPTGGPRTQRL